MLIEKKNCKRRFYPKIPHQVFAMKKVFRYYLKALNSAGYREQLSNLFEEDLSKIHKFISEMSCCIPY